MRRMKLMGKLAGSRWSREKSTRTALQGRERLKASIRNTIEMLTFEWIFSQIHQLYTYLGS